MKVITIGRLEENDVVINDQCASRHHMQIIQHDDGSFTLSDFGSTNGTYVNGQKISGEIPLNEMDIVRIGNTTIPWRMYFEDAINQDGPLNDTYNMHREDTSDSSNKMKKENIDRCKEREEVGVSSVTASLVLLAIMSLPIIVIMIMGAWEFIARLIIALIFGALAFIFAKRADKKANENDVKKAVKAAKNAKGFNVVQIIYGVFSWITVILILINLTVI